MPSKYNTQRKQNNKTYFITAVNENISLYIKTSFERKTEIKKERKKDAIYITRLKSHLRVCTLLHILHIIQSWY